MYWHSRSAGAGVVEPHFSASLESHRTRRFVLALLVTGVLLSALRLDGGTNDWHQFQGGRWAPLEVPVSGKTGFTLLPPQQTGVWFTNRLDELASAANRVLEDGSGVAIGDFNRDGRPDLFFCGLQQPSVLYRNDGNWHFEDITRASGLSLSNQVCRGAVFADLNGDTWPDLLISTLGGGVLCFINDGAGHFINKTGDAGTASKFGSMTLALADVDGNGTLDLYAANYRTDDIRDQSRVEVRRVNGRMVLAPQYQDRLMLVGGQIFEFGEPDALYLNDGHARFTQVPWTGGSFLDEEGQPIAKPPLDWGLTATFRDLNGDGLPDLYVCNDYWTPDRIWLNQGKGTFRQIASRAIRHTSENSMGVDVADIDRDGYPDILVVDMLSRQPMMRKRQVLAQTPMPTSAGEVFNRPQVMRNTLFHNRGDGTFEEMADYAGLPASEWSWQPLFLDVDLDGYEDVLIAAGHSRDVQDLDATKRIQSLQHSWPPSMTPKERQDAFTREMAEHARLYPPLPLPILTFRNSGKLRFAETTDRWGTDSPGVHQGIAYGDLDGDGDLDLAVNNLNGVCGVYRNDSVAPRVAVRLKGVPPNTAGIGATVQLTAGGLPVQKQEVVAGGRYLSGCDALQVFAAGSSSGEMTLEVRWRSGKTSTINHVAANRIYELDEPLGAGGPSPRPTPLPVTPLFKDVSDLIRHKHTENAFDESARQNLLPKRLSQLGPGVAWYDIDKDGDDDLVIGSGAGGALAIFRNNGKGHFENQPGLQAPLDQTGVLGMQKADGQTVLLVGQAGYEKTDTSDSAVAEHELPTGKLTGSFSTGRSSVGPLALADLDGDGVLELFVGGRVVPGRYPEAASSQIYRQIDAGWRIDEQNSQALLGVGLVSGAVWSDLNGDGFPELILACEWGPIRIFQNSNGHLREATREWGLESYTGWWSGVTTGDVDGDGRLDIIAGNWGQNSQYRASQQQPLALFFGDFAQQGSVDLLETEYDSVSHALMPRHRLDTMARAIPSLRAHFESFRQFSEATVEQVLAKLPSPASKVQATTLASMVFRNRGGSFEAIELPAEAQLAPVFSVNAADFDGDGREDIFLSQNFFAMPWEQPRLDAGRGLLLRGDGAGHFTAVRSRESGIEVYGEQRAAATADFNQDGRVDLAVAQNGAETKLYLNQGAQPGVRIELLGSQGNPNGIGAVIQVRFGERWGPAREVHAGSGYWAQDSAIQVLAAPSSATEVKVLWPGGKTTLTRVPPDTHLLRISHPH